MRRVALTAARTSFGAGESQPHGVGGLCWSPDATVLYHADSSTNVIRAHHFDLGRGVITGRREFAATPAHVHPDGSTVDAAGGAWNAQWGSSRVVRYTPLHGD